MTVTKEAIEAAREKVGNPMQFFSQNVDRWGAAEWFDRLAKAIREQDKAVGDDDFIATETFKMIAASSAMALVRNHEVEVRAALSVPAAEVVGEPVPSLETLQYYRDAHSDKFGWVKAPIRVVEDACGTLELLIAENAKFRKALTKIAERADDNLPMYTPGAMVHTAEEALGDGKDGGQEGEAVAWRYSFDEGVTWHHGGEKPGKHRFGGPDIVEPLYTRPQPASTALVERLTKERDALLSGLNAIINCKSPLTRSQMREAAADILDATGNKPKYEPDQSPFVQRADALKALPFTGNALSQIVEGVKGAMEHGTWRDDRGVRLKDTNEWVAFYVTFKAANEALAKIKETSRGDKADG